MASHRLRYHLEGDGTAASPAKLGFTFAGLAGPSLEWLREQLPPTVTVEESGLGFKMKGVSPTMSRSDLSSVFYKLVEDNFWMARHEG